MGAKQETLSGDVGEETIPVGKLMCIVTGKFRKDTAEERVRQNVARSLIEEYGYNVTDLGVEFPIQMGRKKKKADIVVFEEGKIHSQENVYIIVEAKKDDVKPSDKDQGIPQLESYLSACANAKFGLWVGSEKIAYEVIEKEGQRKFIQIPDIPYKGETTAPKPDRDSLVAATNLKQVFRRIHNYIYANQGLQKDKAFEELLKLIFIKVYDEQFSTNLQFYKDPQEKTSTLRTRLEKLFERVRQQYEYIFEPEELKLQDRVLAYAVSELQRFSLVDTDLDVKGEAYEEIVGPNLRGDRGEFFTQRNVCNMTMRMLFSLFDAEKLTSAGTMKVLDPAVGTGGFLISAIHEVKNILNRRGFQQHKVKDLIKNVAETNTFGIDFNPFLVKVSQMNMVMHGDGSTNITQANTLEHPSQWSDEVLEKVFGNEIGKYQGITEFREYLRHLEKPSEIDEALSNFDVVVTNPPFGTKAVIDDTSILSQYEIRTYNANSPRSSLPPEQLFIERCLQLLKVGGFLGIVLPDSILSNPGLQWLREWILERSYIIASIDLPTETFEPHTGTQTSVLFLKKKNPKNRNQKEDYEIFMAIPEKVGHDKRGNPVYKYTPDGNIEIDENGEKVIEDHLPLVAQNFDDWVKQKGLR